MTDPAQTCDHSGFEPLAPEDGARFGQPNTAVDMATLGALMGAAIDGCPPCQERAIDQLQTDPLTTVRLVELAAVSTHALMGGVPDAMTTTGASTMSEPFRRLVRAGLDCEDDHTPMYAAAREMTDAQRRAAVDDAADILAGQLMLKIVPYQPGELFGPRP